MNYFYVITLFLLLSFLSVDFISLLTANSNRMKLIIDRIVTPINRYSLCLTLKNAEYEKLKKNIKLVKNRFCENAAC